MPSSASLFSAIFAMSALAASCSVSDTPDLVSASLAGPLITSDALPPDSAEVESNATMERVVDGDTIIVNIDGQSERIRLIGIDTPESVDQNRPVQCYGHEASAFLKLLLPPGTPISLFRDVEARDQYDRLLAYVVRTDDQVFVNLALVEGGFAAALTYPPNDYYAPVFESAVAVAAASGIGLWGACGGPDVPLP